MKKEIRNTIIVWLLLGLIIIVASLNVVNDNTSSDGKWYMIVTNNSGNTFYVDFDSIKKADGFVYFWMLKDLVKPTSRGIFSNTQYMESDCKLFRYKILSFSYYTEQMGLGTPTHTSNRDTEWRYATPEAADQLILNAVCNR